MDPRGGRRSFARTATASIRSTCTGSSKERTPLYYAQEFFDSPRSPDVFVSPKNGYGFTKGYAAGHGSLSRSETVVPFVFSGPGVSPGILHAARTVDLAPTLLSYLGIAYDPDEMDGEDLEIAPQGVPKPPAVPATPAGDDPPGDD